MFFVGYFVILVLFVFIIEMKLCDRYDFLERYVYSSPKSNKQKKIVFECHFSKEKQKI